MLHTCEGKFNKEKQPLEKFLVIFTGKYRLNGYLTQK